MQISMQFKSLTIQRESLKKRRDNKARFKYNFFVPPLRFSFSLESFVSRGIRFPQTSRREEREKKKKKDKMFCVFQFKFILSINRA